MIFEFFFKDFPLFDSKQGQIQEIHMLFKYAYIFFKFREQKFQDKRKIKLRILQDFCIIEICM